MPGWSASTPTPKRWRRLGKKCTILLAFCRGNRYNTFWIKKERFYMLIPVLLFIVGLLCLIKGGDWFVDGATGAGPPLPCAGDCSSAPRWCPSAPPCRRSWSPPPRAVSGHGEIAYGNAIGSVICNAALIAAITIAVRPGQGGPQEPADAGAVLLSSRGRVLCRRRPTPTATSPAPAGIVAAGDVRGCTWSCTVRQSFRRTPPRPERCGRGH